jgi:hypothetical protein
MTKLRSIATMMAAGVLLSSGVARAADPGSGDGEWATKYGMLFTVQNIFQNNSAGTLSDMGGSVGLQYNLGPQRAVRLTVGLSRASNGSTESENTNLVSGTTTTQFYAPGELTTTDTDDFSSRYTMDVGATYMMRLTSSAVAPYVGAGASLGYTQEAMKWEDDVTTGRPDNEEVDNMTRTFGLGAQGVLGLEWRVHKSVALFAEYAVNLDLVRYSSRSLETRHTSTTDGQLLSGGKQEGSQTTFFNFDTALGQGGMIGLLAFF